MNILGRSTVGIGAAVLLVLASPPASQAATPAPPPRVEFAGEETIRIDRQDSSSLVGAIVTGLAKTSPVTVSFGDGSGTTRLRSRCTTMQARRAAARCAASASHIYMAPGVFNVTVTGRGGLIAQRTVTVVAAPQPWKPPPGFAQPQGWRPYVVGATFVPCQTVRYFVNMANVAPSRLGTVAEIPQALAMIASETALTFVQTDDRSTADLTIDWARGYQFSDGTAGRGGAVSSGGAGTGFVIFNADSYWTQSDYAGFGRTDLGMVQNGWLLIHEFMHALGFDHVDDTTSIMNATVNVGAFNSADLDGLHVMYRDNPCPALP